MPCLLSGFCGQNNKQGTEGSTFRQIWTLTIVYFWGIYVYTNNPITEDCLNENTRNVIV